MTVLGEAPRRVRPVSVLLAAVALLAIVVVASSAAALLAPRDDPAQFPVLGAETIDEARALQRLMEDYEAAWDAHSLAGIASFLADDDFLFFEPGNRRDTKQGFLDFMEPFVTDPEHVGAIDRIYHVGGSELMETYQTWGFAGATEQDPLVEADLFGVREGKIHSIQAMYGAPVLRRFMGIDITPLVGGYAAAWSSGDRATIEALYSAAASRSEQLYGVEQHGDEEIGAFYEVLLRRHPGLTVTVVDPYIFGDATVRAAVLVLADGRCEIPFTALLEEDDDGLISRERVYYDVVAIEDCAWQR